MKDETRAFFLNDRDVSTIIHALCDRLQSLDSISDMLQARAERVERELKSMRMKYERDTVVEEEDFLNV